VLLLFQRMLPVIVEKRDDAQLGSEEVQHKANVRFSV